jgi:hypothetical protein
MSGPFPIATRTAIPAIASWNSSTGIFPTAFVK